MKFSDFISKPVSSVLDMPPFKEWEHLRTADEDLGSVNYEFPGRQFELKCQEDESINVIFLSPRAAANDAWDPEWLEVPFDWSQDQVRAELGVPERHGEPYVSPILGPYGAWDRFDCGRYYLHLEYLPKAPGIKRMTIMSPERAP